MQTNNEQSQKPKLLSQISIDAEDYIERKIKPMFENYSKHKNKDAIPLKKFKKELVNLLSKDTSEEFRKEIFELLGTADLNNSKSIDYNEFKQMILQPKNNLDREKVSTLVKILRNITNTVATESQTKNKLKNFSLRKMFLSMSPPIFIIIISVFQIATFLFYYQSTKKDQIITNCLIKSLFIYDPSKRNQIWRFFTYTLVHFDWSHLIFNLLIQIIIGVPLELNYKWRILIIYMSGCLTGSLCTYLINKEKYLLGSSASIFALVAAFVAYCLCYLSEMKIKFSIFAFFIMVCLVGEYLTTLKAQKLQQSYYIHLCGVLSGFLTGPYLIVQTKINQKLKIARLIGITLYLLAIYIIFFLNFYL